MQINTIIKKTQAIFGQDRGNHVSILKNIKPLRYASNSSAIGDTDVPVRVAATGRESKFTLDIEIGAVPTLDYDKQPILSQ